ncbi:hypothetical protein L915_00858 [Phytophthora nicotianae]|uniref:Transposase Tc1-like domain-containing protein n=1 Tax=Phytophthora nicotianae TaxID=4792 RepID=W2JVD4_PHYNI|nr:hypothetical protein L915_00858 [Phytophthora nicotianae]ETL49747.1 hypothetical protein L916_00848 [Phytophthora nicotianae]
MSLGAQNFEEGRRGRGERRISRGRPTLTPDHEVRRLSWALSHGDRPIV